MRPNEIAEVVCHINAEQDHQAHGTPFGSGPLATAIGCHGDTPQAAHLLQGRIPSTAQMNLLPETIKKLHTIASPMPATTNSAVITPEEFVKTCSIVHEDTSSSSGCHIGHYKAALRDCSLVELHATMMSLPFQIGFAPERWERLTNVLEKEEGNSWCHRL